MGTEVVVEGLTKSFGRHVVWRDISLSLPAGEVSVMLGPSGTGKTVFLKSLVGLIKPDRGRVMVDGIDTVHCSERQLYQVRKLFGVMFQDGALFGSLNLYDNIAFPLREHTKKTEAEIRAGRAGEDGHGRPDRGGAQVPRRDLRRHAQARRAGPRPGARPRDHPVRRAGLRARPGAHRLPVAAADRPQRGDRRHHPDRHARHPDRPDRAGQHRHAVPRQPGHVRPARGAAHQRKPGHHPVRERPQDRADRHVGGEGRGHAGPGAGRRLGDGDAAPRAAPRSCRNWCPAPGCPNGRPCSGAWTG